MSDYFLDRIGIIGPNVQFFELVSLVINLHTVTILYLIQFLHFDHFVKLKNVTRELSDFVLILDEGHQARYFKTKELSHK